MFLIVHTYEVRLAEWSKAPDLSSGTRMCAWVRTPHLTKVTFLQILKQKYNTGFKMFFFSKNGIIEIQSI